MLQVFGKPHPLPGDVVQILTTFVIAPFGSGTILRDRCNMLRGARCTVHWARCGLRVAGRAVAGAERRAWSVVSWECDSNDN